MIVVWSVIDVTDIVGGLVAVVLEVKVVIV